MNQIKDERVLTGRKECRPVKSKKFIHVRSLFLNDFKFESKRSLVSYLGLVIREIGLNIQRNIPSTVRNA